MMADVTGVRPARGHPNLSQALQNVITRTITMQQFTYRGQELLGIAVGPMPNHDRQSGS
jgi:hypothetical protein